MPRALSICGPILCIALGLGGTAWGDKPKIAVLGLEVAIGPGGASDPAAQFVAREVTRELRQRVQAPGSPYDMAPNSNRELIDEKLLMSCENEAPDCMVVIGAGLASDMLLYGRVDRRGDSFRISLKLLDVKRRSVQAATDELPVGGAAGAVARRLYHRLVGDGPAGGGTLIVRARADAGGPIRKGSVLIDNEPRGQLVRGRATVSGIADGRHTVAIDAAGFRRFEEIVTVRGGEPATVDALLHRLPVVAPPAESPDAPRAEHSALWTWSLIGGTALAVGGGG
ncbi:MAG: carboxypeptidase regulatory-like domain-containing protein, partial [Deltaproteobacteria bacterium]